MTDKDKKHLFDIKNAISEIDIIVGDNKNFAYYKEHIPTKRAIERELKIIGEAINRFKKSSPEIEITHAKAIIGLRNRITHAYDSIDDGTIWGIVINHIPALLTEVEILLGK